MRLNSVLTALLLALFLAAFGCAKNGGGADAAAGDSTAVAGADSASAKSANEKKSKSKKKKGKDDEEKKEEAVPVDVAVLSTGSIESVLRASANLEAERSVDVLAEAQRRVRELKVEEGMRVSKGQVLIRLQDDEQKSTLARVESQLAKAQREFDRQDKLFKQNLTMEKVLNDAAYDLDQQKIALDDAKRELSYTEVRAPISGTVTARYVSVGDQVQVGMKVFEIVDFESLVARIYIPEKNLKELKKGLSARVYGKAVSETPFPGYVDRISPIVDPKTGTVKVTVAVGLQEGLRPGLYVDVDLVTAVHNDALLVPKRALIYDNDQTFVYRLLAGRRVERLLVLPVLADRDYIEPLAGLSVGDSLVTAGQAGLKQGALATVVNVVDAGRPDDDMAIGANP